MARTPRIQFPGAIYHAMTRGNARQKVFRDEWDYGRLSEGLKAAVDKFGFEVFSFVCISHTCPLWGQFPDLHRRRRELPQALRHPRPSGYETDDALRRFWQLAIPELRFPNVDARRAELDSSESAS
jgi:hypothetical protein